MATTTWRLLIVNQFTGKLHTYNEVNTEDALRYKRYKLVRGLEPLEFVDAVTLEDTGLSTEYLKNCEIILDSITVP